jgi:DNA-binding transcriptional regulator GbsR (MarR family)
MKTQTIEAKEKFIQLWGEMGPKWGVNKTMAQIHSLLMVSSKPLSTDEIMEELHISRGNANMNLRGLIDWGLVRRAAIKGERREYFQCEKDVWKIFCIVARERKRREIEPVIQTLQECLSIAEKEASPVRDQITALLDFLKTADVVLGKVAQQDQSKLLPRILKLLH